MSTMAEQSRSERRVRVLEEIRTAKRHSAALAVLREFETSVRAEAFAENAGTCPHASVMVPAWMRNDLNRRALEDAERRLIEATLTFDEAALNDDSKIPLDQAAAELTEACTHLRRLRLQCARSAGR